MIVFVGGAAGVGKTTICKRIELITNRRFIHLAFFGCIKKEAELLSKEGMLHKWNELQLSMVSNQIVPFLCSGKNIIFDMHFSFQRAGGAGIAFAKRGFDINIKAESTCSTNFMESLSCLDVPILPFFLYEDPKQIQIRQRLEFEVVLSKKVIEKEQLAEKLHWRMFCRELKNFNVRYLPIKARNHFLCLTISIIMQSIENLKKLKK